MSWYRLIFVFTIFVPFYLVQTTAPVSPTSQNFWENRAENLYVALARTFQPSEPLADTSVGVIKISQKSFNTLGWPLHPDVYTHTLEKLRKNGHPVVLSLLQFQERTNQKEAAKRLADKIRDYGRYVGSNMVQEPDEELNDFQEETLMPRVLVGYDQNEGLPFLGYIFKEPDSFVKAQTAFGFGMTGGAGLAATHCTSMYTLYGNSQSQFALPSALTWAVSLATGQPFTVGSGLSTAAPGQSPMAFDYKHCLKTPGIDSERYMAMRGIDKIELVDYLQNEKFKDNVKLVVLEIEEGQKTIGPMNQAAWEGNLLSWFADDLITGQTIGRQPAGTNQNDQYVLYGALILSLLMAMFLSVRRLASLTGLMTIAILAYTYQQLQAGVFNVPIQAFTFQGAVFFGFTGIWMYKVFHVQLLRTKLQDSLRDKFAQVNTFDEVESSLQAVLSKFFKNSSVQLTCFDTHIYQHQAQPRENNLAVSAVQVPAHTTMRSRRTVMALGNMADSSIHFTDTVEFEGHSLGNIDYQFKLNGLIRDSSLSFCKTIVSELSQHWHRIRLLAERRIKEEQTLVEKTRGEILERFLSQALVGKFSDSATMEENLNQVLTPRHAKAAFLQADIRGYSKIAADMPPMEMVKLLQDYYRNVVEHAQKFSQLKLIGDCIFLFIEESESIPHPVDQALEVARHLASENKFQNERHGHELNFGIGIHYGDVVIGNLSSDLCIDYTVIGPNVNLVARLEEVTKQPQIQKLIGHCGILLTHEAYAHLDRYKHLPKQDVDFSVHQTHIRSFENIASVQYATTDDLFSLDRSWQKSA